MTVIEVRNLVRSFGQRRVLDGANLRVEKGETMVIMGCSGCGKSVLMKHLVGTLKPDSGQILINGEDITRMSEARLNQVRKRFGMLFQGAALFNSMTVGENVALPLREHTKLSDEIIKIIVKMKLELVGLTGFEDLKPAEISGGMKKRVGLARAIAMDPEIVFYDEPGAGLDPIVLGVIDKLIRDLSKKLNITSVVVTHEMESGFRIADRIAMLHQGKIIEVGTPEEIRSSRNEIVQQFIIGSPEGPIPMRRSSDEYLRDLTGM